MSLRPSLFLLAAVGTEIIGITAMKLAADKDSLAIMFFMYGMIALSFYLLSFVVLYVPLGLAYALWESIGMTSITVIGYLAFAETMSLYKVAGITLLVAGVVIVKLANPDEKIPETSCSGDAATLAATPGTDGHSVMEDKNAQR